MSEDADVDYLMHLQGKLRASEERNRWLEAENQRLRTAAGGECGGEGLSPLNGGRPLPTDRDTLGRMVRETWVRWAQTQPNPKPSWLAPYDDLSEPDKEADRQIGEAVARWTLIHDAAVTARDAQRVPRCHYPQWARPYDFLTAVFYTA